MSQAESEQEAPTFDKDNPFAAKITENRLLNKEGSSKDTRHFVVDISGSGLRYTCGDSIGIYPTNDSAYVENVLSTLNFTGDEMVVVPKVDRALPLRAALMHKLSLAGPSKKFFQTLLAKCGENELVEARRYLEPGSRKELMAYLEQRELIDFFEEIPSARWEPQELVNLMKRLVPRLYSIASSPTLHPNDVHLTVAIVRYQTNGRDRNGVCTTYMTDRVKLDDPSVPIFIASSHFGLPEDMGKDVIMVGPGTGIAPFRAFLQERDTRNDFGRNWLFFGDQHASTDYLYCEELESWQKDGFIQNLSLAFSRDQEEKVYVQHKMLDKGKELWDWLESGAFFYVCGDAKRMAGDVDTALHQIAQEHGGLDEAGAKSYFKDLKNSKRYQRDVY